MPRSLLPPRWLLLWVASLVAVARGAGGPPNILFILADDLGIGDVACYRQADVRTPAMDRLAGQGMRYTGMRANATVCSPTRAAILTGRYPDRVGVPGVIRTDPGDSWGWLAPGVPTLADHLRTAGYRTALVGKWHLGLTSPNLPNDRGFDHFHGFLGDMMDSYTDHLRHGNNYMRLNREPIRPEGHATELFTDWAIDWLRARREDSQPFFLFLAYNAPHFPIEPPAAWLERVRRREPDLDASRARNVAFVEHLDHSVGRVLDALEDLGAAADTLIVFTSDNGGSLPHAQSNAPWRDGKQSHFDGGLRVPFVARWDGRIPAGIVREHAGLTFDIFPTCLELAGVAAPPGMDAVSLVPTFSGASPADGIPRELYFVRREGGLRHGGGCYEALIRGPWKLLRNDPFSPYQLYHLGEDPLERVDVATWHPDIVRELGAILRRHIQRGGAVPWQPPEP